MDEPCSDFARENRHAMMEAVKEELTDSVKHISFKMMLMLIIIMLPMKSTTVKRSGYTERVPYVCGKECWELSRERWEATPT